MFGSLLFAPRPNAFHNSYRYLHKAIFSGKLKYLPNFLIVVRSTLNAGVILYFDKLLILILGQLTYLLLSDGVIEL